jgi:hypothetical protein
MYPQRPSEQHNHSAAPSHLFEMIEKCVVNWYEHIWRVELAEISIVTCHGLKSKGIQDFGRPGLR